MTDWWETAHRYWLASQGAPGPRFARRRAGADARHAGDVRGGQCDRPALPELSRTSRRPTGTASQDAAAATAAYKVLLKHYPANKAALDESYTLSMAQIADGPAREAGMAIGEKAAEAAMNANGIDPAIVQQPYRPRTVPGEWVATALAVARALLGGDEALGDRPAPTRCARRRRRR